MGFVQNLECFKRVNFMVCERCLNEVTEAPPRRPPWPESPAAGESQVRTCGQGELRLQPRSCGWVSGEAAWERAPRGFHVNMCCFPFLLSFEKKISQQHIFELNTF